MNGIIQRMLFLSLLLKTYKAGRSPKGIEEALESIESKKNNQDKVNHFLFSMALIKVEKDKIAKVKQSRVFS
jgi:hypothetical protein